MPDGAAGPDGTPAFGEVVPVLEAGIDGVTVLAVPGLGGIADPATGARLCCMADPVIAPGGHPALVKFAFCTASLMHRSGRPLRAQASWKFCLTLAQVSDE